MNIITVQPISIVRSLDLGQTVYPNDKLIRTIHEEDQLLRSYKWMSNKMNEKNIWGRKTQYPFWGWRRYDNYEGINIVGSPQWDPTDYGWGKSKESCIIELSLPMTDILLSDFDLWSFVLGNDFLNPNIDRHAYDVVEDWYANLPENEKEEVKMNSWESIFNLDVRSPYSNMDFIQCTFWCIKPSDVVSIIYNT